MKENRHERGVVVIHMAKKCMKITEVKLDQVIGKKYVCGHTISRDVLVN